MAISRSKAKISKTIEGTPGGVTYVIKLPNEQDGRPICFRKMRSDPAMRCTNTAGYKTDHVGTGACMYHGGNNTKNARIIHGRDAKVTRLRLNDKIQEYLNKDRNELLDLTYHLAATRVIFDEFIEDFPKANEENYGVWFHRFTQIIGTLGTLVEKISRVDNRASLTAAQVLYIRASMVDLFMKYIPDPDIREMAVRELAKRMGGDVEADMRPSEIALPQSVIDG
jgi:hypothetical protein